MEDHVRICEELFSAARSGFKHLIHFYFHNCVYDSVWRDQRRRHVEQVPVIELLHTYDPSHRAVFVGDASICPYEIEKEGGSVERWNDEPGEIGYAACSTLIQRRLGPTRCPRNIGPAQPASA
jgi:uncharacterized protein with von Willebrand factor type A (vWA) domain